MGGEREGDLAEGPARTQSSGTDLSSRLLPLHPLPLVFAFPPPTLSFLSL